MNSLVSSPFFGLVLCILAYRFGHFCKSRLKTPLANPILIAIVLIISFLACTGIPLESFNAGGDVISLFLTPATIALAITIYRQRQVLSKYFLPVVAGCFVGALTAIISVILFSRLFGVDEVLQASLLPKSVTTPIAMELSKEYGGIVSVTVSAVMVTGTLGIVLVPFLLKLFRFKDPVVVGLSIGVSCHGIGTATAVEMGEMEGAMSGIAIGVTGLATVLLMLFFG